jgi:GGDEF domain-containing protein
MPSNTVIEAESAPASIEDRMVRQIAEAVEHLAAASPREDGSDEPQNPIQYSKGYLAKLAVLRALLEMEDPVITPTLDPVAPRGHACAPIDKALSVPAGESLRILDDLADLGLLERDLFNLVHVCPGCQRCQLNFRETCCECGAIDIEIEHLVHHFSCAYTGLESEFAQDIDLICPKCRNRLFQLGQDFDRPHDSYVCRHCNSLFEEPKINVQCLSCRSEFPGSELDVVRIHRYRPTALTVRAVELNRLTGLNVSEIMIDANVRLATMDYLVLESRREAYRMRRYESPFSGATLTFVHRDGPYPIFNEWSTDTIRELGRILTSSIRDLDLVAKLDHSRIGLLFPETDANGLGVVRQRILARFEDMDSTTRAGQRLQLRWEDATWIGSDVDDGEVLSFYDAKAETP